MALVRHAVTERGVLSSTNLGAVVAHQRHRLSADVAAHVTKLNIASLDGTASSGCAPELRDHIATFRRLAQLYATVRNAYADKVAFGQRIETVARKRPLQALPQRLSWGGW